MLSQEIQRKPGCSAPAFNEIPPIKHIIFGPKKHFHSYLHVGNNNFIRSLVVLD